MTSVSIGTIAPVFERANLADTKQFRVSPFLRGTWANAVDYELRYARYTSRTDSDIRADIDEETVLARMGTAEMLEARLGWGLEYSRTNYDYSRTREVSLSQVLGSLHYALTPTVLLRLRGGRESNDVLTTDTESYSTWGGGVDWRPQQNFRLSADANKRFFGHDHSLQMQYQMRRVLVRYTDSRNVYNNQVGLTEDQQTLSGLLNNLYSSRESDPVRRALLVQGEQPIEG